MSDISCMGYNVLSYDTHFVGFEPAAVRFGYVLKTIDDNDPDLVGVQEACEEGSSKSGSADFEWCGELIKAMAERGYGHSALREQADFTLPKQTIACGLIIFFKKDRFEMTDSGCKGYLHDPSRWFQWVKLTDKKFDRPILFTNTHFSINPMLVDKHSGVAGDAYRTVEATKLINFWNKECPPDTALFATGDYNSVPTSPAQTLLRSKQFKPSVVVAKEYDEFGTTLGGRMGHSIDFCYVNPEAQEVDAYRVLRDRYPSDADSRVAGYASDHRAIMTYTSYK